MASQVKEPAGIDPEYHHCNSVLYHRNYIENIYIDNKNIYMLSNKCNDKNKITLCIDIKVPSIEYHHQLSTTMYYSPFVLNMKVKRQFKITFKWKPSHKDSRNVPFISYYDNENYAFTVNDGEFCLQLVRTAANIGGIGPGAILVHLLIGIGI